LFFSVEKVDKNESAAVVVVGENFGSPKKQIYKK
jgi:hypothetical protein